MVRLATCRPEELPIHHPGIAIAQATQPLAPCFDRLRIRNAQRDMMDAARTVSRPAQVVAHDDVHLRMCSTLPDVVHVDLVARRDCGGIRVVGRQAEALGEESGRFERRDCECRVAKHRIWCSAGTGLDPGNAPVATIIDERSGGLSESAK